MLSLDNLFELRGLSTHRVRLTSWIENLRNSALLASAILFAMRNNLR